MKKIFPIIILIIYSNQLIAQKDKEKIESAIIGLFNGLSLINADTLNYYATPDFHLLEDGEVWNMDTLLNRIMPRKNANIKRINKFEFIRTVQKKNMAWVSYLNTAEFSQGDKKRTVKWMESAVLQKENKRWRIQLLHSTPIE